MAYLFNWVSWDVRRTFILHKWRSYVGYALQFNATPSKFPQLFQRWRFFHDGEVSRGVDAFSMDSHCQYELLASNTSL